MNNEITEQEIKQLIPKYNRAQKRKMIHKAGKKNAEAIQDFSEQFSYIAMIQKIKEIRERIEKEGENKNEAND